MRSAIRSTAKVSSVYCPLEHQIQGVEHRASDVPVVVVRLEMERVGIGEQKRQTVGDFLAILVGDSDVNGNLLSDVAKGNG